MKPQARIFQQRVVVDIGEAGRGFPRLRTEGGKTLLDSFPSGHNVEEKVRDAHYGADMFVWAEDLEGRWIYGLWASSHAWRAHQKGSVEVHLVRPDVLQYAAKLAEDDKRVTPYAFANYLRSLGVVRDATSSTPYRRLKMVESYDTYLSFSLSDDDTGRHESHPIYPPLDDYYVSPDGKTLKIDQRKWFRDPQAIREYRHFPLSFLTKETIGTAVVNTAGIRAAWRSSVVGDEPAAPRSEDTHVNPAALRELSVLVPANSLLKQRNSITVNGCPASTFPSTTYGEVLALANMRPGASVTYSKGPPANRKGTLYEGKRVEVQDGMAFCVAYTTNA